MIILYCFVWIAIVVFVASILQCESAFQTTSLQEEEEEGERGNDTTARIGPMHWLLLHYHKSGHDLVRLVCEATLRKSCIAPSHQIFPARVDFAPFVNSPALHRSKIVILAANDTLFDWHDVLGVSSSINTTTSNTVLNNGTPVAAPAAGLATVESLPSRNSFRIVHWVRDPYDMVVSAFLYHSLCPVPTGEGLWTVRPDFDPCAVDESTTHHQYA